MDTRSKAFIMIIAFTVLLFGVTMGVYHQVYTLYQNRVIEDGNKWGNHIQEMFQQRIAFVQEDLSLFSTAYDLRNASILLEKGVTNEVLVRRFISFFQIQYGHNVYEKVVLTDDQGCVVASTGADKLSCEMQEWWQEAVSKGRAFRFISDKHGRAMLLVAIRIGGNHNPIGVLYGESYLAPMIEEAGHFESAHIKNMELFSSDWRLLYSTSLHRTGDHRPELEKKLAKGEVLRDVYQMEIAGRKEILIVKRPTAAGIGALNWILVLSLDSERLFQPVYVLRWWIGGGVSSLILMAILFLYLIRNLHTKAIQERELTKHQQILETILDGIEAGIVFIDKEEFVISHMSEVAGRLLGVEPNELIGKSCYEYICRYGHQFHYKGCPAVGKRSLHTEFELNRLDGKAIPITKSVLEVSFNNKPHYVEVIFDITKRKEIEKQLAHALKLESIGSLAAGIAHEINTPAQYITDNLKFIRKAYESCVKFWEAQGMGNSASTSETEDIDYYMSEVPTALEQSLEGITSITTTVQALKKLSHPGVDLFEMSDLNSILENIAVVCRNEWKYSAELQFQLNEALPLVRCNTHDISQLFLNLIVNAAHAVNKKHSQSLKKGLIIIRSSVDGSNVVVEIEDDGIGIPDGLKERVYDPFFTTKEVGQGSGQGLSISYAIMQKHRGEIEFTSEEGVGTNFIVRLPINSGEGNQ